MRARDTFCLNDVPSRGRSDIALYDAIFAGPEYAVLRKGPSASPTPHWEVAVLRRGRVKSFEKPSPLQHVEHGCRGYYQQHRHNQDPCRQPNSERCP